MFLSVPSISILSVSWQTPRVSGQVRNDFLQDVRKRFLSRLHPKSLDLFDPDLPF
jgi:hypothetical protein